MLRTSVKDLKEQIKKEEYQQKFKIKTTSNANFFDQINSLFQSDHLPFYNLIANIACGLANAPKKPDFRIRLDNE